MKEILLAYPTEIFVKQIDQATEGSPHKRPERGEVLSFQSWIEFFR